METSIRFHFLWTTTEYSVDKPDERKLSITIGKYKSIQWSQHFCYQTSDHFLHTRFVHDTAYESDMLK